MFIFIVNQPTLDKLQGNAIPGRLPTFYTISLINAESRSVFSPPMCYLQAGIILQAIKGIVTEIVSDGIVQQYKIGSSNFL